MTMCELCFDAGHVCTTFVRIQNAIEINVSGILSYKVNQDGTPFLSALLFTRLM